MNDQIARSKAVLSQLLDQWEQHGDQYGAVMYRAALVKNGEKWQSAFTLLCPTRKGENEQCYCADYRDLLILRGSFSVPEAKATLVEIIERGRLILPDVPPVELSVYLDSSMVRRHGSQGRRFPIQYASHEYTFQTAGQRPNVSNGFVCAPDLPLYPHPYAAIEHLLAVRMINQTAEIVALAPDYRARVKKVRLSRTGATVEIEAPEGYEGEILGKVFHEAGGALTHCDLSFQNGTAPFTAPGYPRKMIVVLMARDGRDVIDEWFYDSDIPQGYHNPWMPQNSGAEIEANEENLENLILGGESETLEFKEKVPDKWEVVTTVSGFANSSGGRLLVGVSDNGEIVGCADDKLADKFTNIVHAHCDPAPSFTTSSLAIRGTSIVVVNVDEGKDKPYVVPDRGIYIRVGATTRRANRYEIDRFYTAKQFPVSA